MRCWAIAILSAVVLSAAASGVEPGDPFSEWPKSWGDAYRRFEKFIAGQSQNVPASDLEILSEGDFLTALPGEINRERHTSIAFFKDGADILEINASKGGLFDGEYSWLFPPGVYAACLKTCDEVVGYQYRHPLVWFQIGQANTNDPSGAQEKDRFSARMVEQPQPAQDYWPDDRLLRFCDFQVFPKINPLYFFRQNNKVSPNVTLAVTNTGIVQRGKLDGSLEKLLRWRIYHNGRLVEKGAATDDLLHAVAQGTGTYVVFAGVEGPNGFMPVSNFLQFPLFPEKDGTFAVLPSVTNSDGIPDCLLEALPPDQVGRLRSAESWTTRSRGYNPATIYALNSIDRAVDEKKQTLIALWSSWAWSVNLAKVEPESNIARIQMAPAPK